MKDTSKIPTTIITGFLGAGKTSLIRYVMENSGGRRIALLINEFGDVGVDGDILKSCSNEGCPENAIIELPNGCICCTVADDFVPAMEKLLALPGTFDHIVIETSGLALPKPLVKAFDWPAIRSRLTVDGVIAVVDGPAVATGDFADDLDAIAKQKEDIGLLDHDNPLAEVYEDQLLCADLIILNKIDQMNAATRAKVKDDIAKIVSPAVGIIEAAFGIVDANIMLGLKAAAENDVANRVSHHDTEEEHDHEDFESFVVELPPVSDVMQLHEHIMACVSEYGILRVKGFVRIENKPMRYLVQAVGKRISGHFDGACKGNEGKVVVIGRKGLNKEGILSLLLESRLASVA